MNHSSLIVDTNQKNVIGDCQTEKDHNSDENNRLLNERATNFERAMLMRDKARHSCKSCGWRHYPPRLGKQRAENELNVAKKVELCKKEGCDGQTVKADHLRFSEVKGGGSIALNSAVQG